MVTSIAEIARKVLIFYLLSSLQAAENFNASRVRLRFTRVKEKGKLPKAIAVQRPVAARGMYPSPTYYFMPARSAGARQVVLARTIDRRYTWKALCNVGSEITTVCCC